MVVKDATPDDPQDFAFTAGGGLSPASFQLDDDSNADAVEHPHVHGRGPPGGGYSSPRRVPAGWDQTERHL